MTVVGWVDALETALKDGDQQQFKIVMDLVIQSRVTESAAILSGLLPEETVGSIDGNLAPMFLVALLATLATSDWTVVKTVHGEWPDTINQAMPKMVTLATRAKYAQFVDLAAKLKDRVTQQGVQFQLSSDLFFQTKNLKPHMASVQKEVLRFSGQPASVLKEFKMHRGIYEGGFAPGHTNKEVTPTAEDTQKYKLGLGLSLGMDWLLDTAVKAAASGNDQCKQTGAEILDALVLLKMEMNTYESDRLNSFNNTKGKVKFNLNAPELSEDSYIFTQSRLEALKAAQTVQDRVQPTPKTHGRGRGRYSQGGYSSQISSAASGATQIPYTGHTSTSSSSTQANPNPKPAARGHGRGRGGRDRGGRGHAREGK